VTATARLAATKARLPAAGRFLAQVVVGDICQDSARAAARGRCGAVEDAMSQFVTGRHFVAGEWTASAGGPTGSASGTTFESRNPADRRDLIGTFQAGTANDAAVAIAAALAAGPAWRATPAPRRGEILLDWARLLRRDKERLARALTREMGKVIAEARGDVQEAIDIAELMAGEGRRMFGDTVPSELPDKWAMSIRQPIGVAGIITPWNFPMAIPAWKMTAALVAGNTVVLKPASDTPGCATLLVELMAEAGFPPGVVNLVTGSGTGVGDAIVESPDVPVISFTGSTATGKHIAERAGRQLKRLALELGGKNAIVVLRDADLDLAVDGIVWSAFGTTGQRCTACSRVIVEDAVADALLARLEPRVRALRLGDGLDPATDVGPLINEAARTKVEGYVEIGRTEGELVCGGSRATGGALDGGTFFEPTIFTGVRPGARIAQEEIFGPVLSVIPVPDYEAAMAAANGIRYGLSASIYTSSVNTAFRAMRDFESGLVYVNAGTIGAETHLPFGGWKETGNGHSEAGHAALDTFTEWKSIYVDFSGRLQRAQIDNQPG
jgi:alpha-ketoglutaric semialdehyde dehydrogenase